METVIAIVVWALIVYVLWWVIGYLNPPEPFKKVATVLLVLFGFVGLLHIFGFVGTPFYRGRW